MDDQLGVVKDVDEKIEDNRVEVNMPDLPLELEIRLKKEAKRKRKFKPITIQTILCIDNVTCVLIIIGLESPLVGIIPGRQVVFYFYWSIYRFYVNGYDSLKCRKVIVSSKAKFLLSGAIPAVVRIGLSVYVTFY
ncbi:hypothetical protein BD560DRAFT_428804 [Blakeslea trispora]|nr:hypothetical protein BD560DRAFT_428804 [Blakeslea trispora]